MLYGFRRHRAAASRNPRPMRRLATSPNPLPTGVKVQHRYPNLRLFDREGKVVSLHPHIDKRPTIVVMSDCVHRIQGYINIHDRFAEQRHQILLICSRPHMKKLPFLVFGATEQSLQELKSLGHPIVHVPNGKECIAPSTTILDEDQTVLGHSDAKGVDPTQEAEMTLEYLFMTKLALSDISKRLSV